MQSVGISDDYIRQYILDVAEKKCKSIHEKYWYFRKLYSTIYFDVAEGNNVKE